MSVESVRFRAQEITANGGRSILHSLAPDDFEYYACTMMLIDSIGNIKQLFNFPVLPTSMQINKRPLVNIKKTARGYINQFSTSFSGDVISINGTFGRKFKLLTSNLNSKNKQSDAVFDNGVLDTKVKTGYGALKLLEKIIYSSTKLDDFGKPMRLYFYNFSFNEAFYIEVVNWSKQQSMENNIMWNFSIEMKCLARIEDLLSLDAAEKKKTIKNLLSTSFIQKSTNRILNQLTFSGVLR
jgi:hypothetical protein